MLPLVLYAYKELLSLERWLRRDGYFSSIYERVRNYPLRQRESPRPSIEDVCEIVNRACLWYPRPVLCLGRSALTTYLLRRSGIAAQMVIGAQLIPFRAHAWVEVDDQVVNDHPHVRDIYAILDRC
jgi:hypothetical protein